MTLPRSAAVRACMLAGLAGAGLALAPVAARAQSTDTAPSAPGGTAVPPEVVKPRGPGSAGSTAGVIHPGPTGDTEMHMAPPAGKSFPTPVINPQTMQGGAAVVPK